MPLEAPLSNLEALTEARGQPNGLWRQEWYGWLQRLVTAIQTALDLIKTVTFAETVSGSAVTLTTGTAANIAQVSVGPGEFIFSGVVHFLSNVGTTSFQTFAASISETSATIDTSPRRLSVLRHTGGFTGIGSPPSVVSKLVTPFHRSLSAQTTVFLVAAADFSGPSPDTRAYGYLQAHRIG